MNLGGPVSSFGTKAYFSALEVIMQLDHYDGFEKEKLFHNILGQALCDNPNIKARTINNVIYRVAPEFMEGLFMQRPCVRKLKYIGCWDICCEFPLNDSPHDNGMILGKIYTSKTFNGAVYILKGKKSPIGSAFFEVVAD